MHLTYSPVTGEFYRGSARVGSQHGAGYINAHIKHKGKKIHLGCYAAAEEASAAYQAKKAELHSLAPLKPDQ